MMLIDIGNTRLKIYESGGCITAITHEQSIEKIKTAILSVKVNLDSVVVKIVSVATSEINEALKEIIQTQGGEAWFAQVDNHALGVSCGYKYYEQLGVDRWLGVVAGYNMVGKNNVLVVDAGTAVTIDLIQTGGEHKGGYIIPGVSLSLQALSKGTMAENINSAGIEMYTLAEGVDTKAAMENGVLLAICGAVVAEICRVGRDCLLVLTGGDGLKIKQILQSEFGVKSIYQKDLVLEGLIMLYEEKNGGAT